MEVKPYLIGLTELVFPRSKTTMPKISKSFNFSMGHALNNYAGKCHDLHGHNYDLIVCVEAAELDASGFVMDFGDLKKVVNDVLDNYGFDHCFRVCESDPRADALTALGATKMEAEPTAENLIIVLAKLIEAKLHNVTLASLDLYETPTSQAHWQQPS